MYIISQNAPGMSSATQLLFSEISNAFELAERTNSQLSGALIWCTDKQENKSPTSALDGQDVVKIEGLELLKDNGEAKTASKDEKGSRESPVGSDAGDSKIKEKISVSSGTPEDDGDTILEYPNHRITDEIIQKVCQGMATRISPLVNLKKQLFISIDN